MANSEREHYLWALKTISDAMEKNLELRDSPLSEALRKAYSKAQNPIPQPEPEGRVNRVNQAIGIVLMVVYSTFFIWFIGWLVLRWL